jgi:hypothetical protein
VVLYFVLGLAGTRKRGVHKPCLFLGRQGRAALTLPPEMSGMRSNTPLTWCLI